MSGHVSAFTIAGACVFASVHWLWVGLVLRKLRPHIAPAATPSLANAAPSAYAIPALVVSAQPPEQAGAPARCAREWSAAAAAEALPARIGFQMGLRRATPCHWDADASNGDEMSNLYSGRFPFSSKLAESHRPRFIPRRVSGSRLCGTDGATGRLCATSGVSGGP